MTPLPVPFVPVPTRLLDDLMPTLRDTEWRVLCVVARATLGWRGPRPGTRRERATLSHAQLKARTGREGEAVSAAVASLVAAGYLETLGPGGAALRSPSERRRAGRRLSYRLSPYLLVPAQPGSASIAGVWKPKRANRKDQ